MREACDGTILIVDDVESNLIALEAALMPLGRPIIKARSGTEALAQLLDREFALVLMDVQMPGMDGYEAARFIRSRERTRDLPIIFLTAHDHTAEAVKRGYALGIVDFLFKPLDVDVLRAKTHVFIALHERTKQVALLEAQRLLDEQREQFLKRLNEQLALADRRKTEFLATLSHELRNPLAPIRTSLDLIRANPGTSPSDHVLDVLDRQVDHVTRLVDDMLDISRIVAGKLELRSEVLELGSVIEQALTVCRPEFSARKQVLDVRRPNVPIPVSGDALRLVQIVSNLLTNAARYTTHGGAIEISWAVRDGRATVVVTDNGIGIEPGMIDSLFEMFAQEGVRRDHGGLGLGLTLAKRLVELHGGTLHASSAGRDQGSTFEIGLPVSNAPPDPARPLLFHRTDTVIVRRRVLVVDDNDDARDLTAAMLASRGHEVTTAVDGPSALAALRDRSPEVALVDIGLPGFDGFELARRFRETCPDATTRLIAMTGYGQESDRERSRLVGFEGHLVKPVPSSEILRAIDAVCSPDGAVSRPRTRTGSQTPHGIEPPEN